MKKKNVVQVDDKLSETYVSAVARTVEGLAVAYMDIRDTGLFLLAAVSRQRTVSE